MAIYYNSTDTSAATVWPSWFAGATTTAGTGSNVWAVWTNDTTSTSSAKTIAWAPVVWTTWAESVAETQEQKAERLERERVWREGAEQRRIEQEAAAAKLREEQAAAVARAEELLTTHLSGQQASEYERLKSFLVKAASGKTYRIRKGWSGNVDLLNDEGEAIMRFCIHPSVNCPDQDNMLAQKFLLENDEEAFTKIANKTPIRMPVAA